MDIKTQDYKGGDRRNGSKLKLTAGDWIRLVVLLCTIVGGGIIGWIKMDLSVQALAEDIIEVDEACEKSQKKDIEQDQSIAELSSGIDHIKEDVQEMKVEQKEQKSILYQILGKLNGSD